MKVNSAKTQMIVLGTPAMLRSLPNVTINFCGNIIVDSKVVKNLGVMLDRHLNFEHHVSTIQNKATGILIALNNARHVIPKRLMPAIVQGLVISIIRYCICIYGSCGTTQTHRIQKMLNFCARVVSGRRKHDHISDVIRSLRWLTAEQLVHYHTASSVLKTIITGAPPYIAGTIGAPAHTVHDHHTRRPTHHTLPRIRTETGRRRLCYRGVKLLNDLLVPSENVPSRKALMKAVRSRDVT